MKAPITTLGSLLGIGLVSFAVLASSAAYANVKYRVGYDATTSEYSVYMTPDSVPSPDILLSAQVTLVAPVQNGVHFTVQNIQSFMPELVWNMHSRVDTPIENTSSDYLSFGSISTGSMPKPFGWVTGEEKKIFSFTNPGGCVDGAGLLEDTDPFNVPSNSAQTNPGNYFSNLGWSIDNNYVGNYGGVINCSGTVGDNNDVLGNHDKYHGHHDVKINDDKRDGKKHGVKKHDAKHSSRDRKTLVKRPSLYVLP